MVRSTNLPVFGFSDSDPHVVGFDQGYFRSVNESLGQFLGIRDDLYRRLLKMRARLTVSRMSVPELDAAVGEVVPGAAYQDSNTRALTLYIGTEIDIQDKSVCAPLWPRPATVRLVINDTTALPL